MLVELGREFPQVDSKGYNYKPTSDIREKHETKFYGNSSIEITRGIKRNLNQIRGYWKRLKIQSKKEHDTQNRECRKTGGNKASRLHDDKINAVQTSFK